MSFRNHPPLPPAVKRLAYRTLGAAFRVHTALGPNLKEKHYRQCVLHALRRDGLRAVEHPEFDVEFEGLVMKGALQPDLVVEDTIVLELKASSAPADAWEAQTLSYVYQCNFAVGYLINFRVAHLRRGIKPFINHALAGPACGNNPQDPVHPVHPVHPVRISEPDDQPT